MLDWKRKDGKPQLVREYCVISKATPLFLLSRKDHSRSCASRFQGRWPRRWILRLTYATFLLFDPLNLFKFAFYLLPACIRASLPLGFPIKLLPSYPDSLRQGRLLCGFPFGFLFGCIA